MKQLRVRRLVPNNTESKVKPFDEFSVDDDGNSSDFQRQYSLALALRLGLYSKFNRLCSNLISPQKANNNKTKTNKQTVRADRADGQRANLIGVEGNGHKKVAKFS